MIIQVKLGNVIVFESTDIQVAHEWKRLSTLKGPLTIVTRSDGKGFCSLHENIKFDSSLDCPLCDLEKEVEGLKEENEEQINKIVELDREVEDLKEEKEELEEEISEEEKRFEDISEYMPELKTLADTNRFIELMKQF